MFGDAVENPMEWEMSCIEDAVAQGRNSLKAGPFGSSLKKEFYVETGYKIYGQEQVIRGDAHYGDYFIDEDKFHSLQSCEVKANDVLISLVGTYGKLLIIPDDFEPGIINPRLMKITFNPEKVNTTYFRYFFGSDSVVRSLSENTHGGTMDILNLGIVRKIKLPLPPLPLQNRFADFVRQVDKSKFTVLLGMVLIKKICSIRRAFR
jgi:type I restriction enzyme S subunit